MHSVHLHYARTWCTQIVKNNPWKIISSHFVPLVWKGCVPRYIQRWLNGQISKMDLQQFGSRGKFLQFRVVFFIFSWSKQMKIRVFVQWCIRTKILVIIKVRKMSIFDLDYSDVTLTPHDGMLLNFESVASEYWEKIVADSWFKI